MSSLEGAAVECFFIKPCFATGCGERCGGKKWKTDQETADFYENGAPISTFLLRPKESKLGYSFLVSVFGGYEDGSRLSEAGRLAYFADNFHSAFIPIIFYYGMLRSYVLSIALSAS